MISWTLTNLSPLIQVSDLWVENDPQSMWLTHNNGMIALAPARPEVIFAEVHPCDQLPTESTTVERLTCFIEWPSGRHALIAPAAWVDGAPFEGRPHIPRQYDCYTLVRDWMARERGIEMLPLSDTPERLASQFLTDGAFVNNKEAARWERVVRPQAGDGILFAVNQRSAYTASVANHCGVYLGNDQFLHHFAGRASCIITDRPCRLS